MISHKHKCIFIHIPRTGGTSIEHALVGSDWAGIDKFSKHLYARSSKELYAEYWDGYYTFSFSRNPWARAVSVWKKETLRSARVSLPPQEKEIYKELIHPNPNRLKSPFTKKSFSFFIEKNGLDLKVSRNQVDFLLDGDGKAMVDFIGRTERLAIDFQHVCNKIKTPPKKLPHVNKIKHRPYWEYYTPETQEIVRDKYQRDIDYFGYKFKRVRVKKRK